MTGAAARDFSSAVPSDFSGHISPHIAYRHADETCLHERKVNYQSAAAQVRYMFDYNKPVRETSVLKTN